MNYYNESQATNKIDITRQSLEPVYLVDWGLVAEQADLEKMRWQLIAQLARLNQALEALGGGS